MPLDCYMPSDPGHCMAAFHSYYYDHESNACKEFVYGGCGGNNNRFISQEECLAECAPAPAAPPA